MQALISVKKKKKSLLYSTSIITQGVYNFEFCEVPPIHVSCIIKENGT